jgi:hypothetical protein
MKIKNISVNFVNVDVKILWVAELTPNGRPENCVNGLVIVEQRKRPKDSKLRPSRRPDRG